MDFRQKVNSLFILYPYGMIDQTELTKGFCQAKTKGTSVLLWPL
jgi:hypothetical protein